MYDVCPEHNFNSFPPKYAAKATQRIGKTRSKLARIPRMDNEGSLLGFSSKVPKPNDRRQPKTYRRSTFGTSALPRLRLLAADKLFGVLESILDAPSTRKTSNDFGCGKAQIRSEEKVILLFARRVSTDNQQHGLLRYPVPDNFSGIDKPFFVLASLAGFDQLEVVNSSGHLFRRKKLLAFFSGSASPCFSFLHQHIVNIRVPAHSGDYIRIGDCMSGQRSEETVAMAQKSPLGKPKSYFCQHLFGQFGQRKTTLSVQSHVYRQAERSAAPGGIDSQGQNNQIQSPGNNDLCATRTHRISPPSGSVDFSAAVVKQRIVQIGVDASGRIEYPDQQNRQIPPQLAHCPGSIREKPVIRIVSFLSAWLGERQNSGDSMSSGTENPSGYEIQKYLCRWCCEYWKKVLNYIRPCRDNTCSIHTNLPIVSVSIQSSEGWYVFDYSPLKLTDRKVRKFSLVRDVFFAGSPNLPFERFIGNVSNKSEVLLTLLGAKHRGARISNNILQDLLKVSNSEEAWRAYAWLGSSECSWILDNFLNKTTVIAKAALHHVPEKIMPVLLDMAINDNRRLNSSPDHPLRIIDDWIESAYPGSGEVIKRRKLIFKNANEWINTGGNLVIGLKAIGTSLSPHFRDSKSDPGAGRTITFTQGLIQRNEMKEIQLLWPKLIGLLKSQNIQQWEPIQEIVRDWLYLGPGLNKVPESIRKMTKSFVRKMLYDFIGIANNQQGALRWIKSITQRYGYRIPVPLDKEFEILYPIREHEDWQKHEKKEVKAVDKLAKQWATKKPQTIVKKMMTFQLEASQSGNAWSKWIPRMCYNLANTTKTPCSWIKSFLSQNADGSYIGPFLERAVEINESGWETYAHQCIKKDNTRYSAVSVLLTKDNLPDTIFEEVLNNLENLKDTVNHICTCYSLSEKTVKKLLTHKDPNIGSAAAIGEWTREPKGNIRESLKKEWRKTIIKCPEDEYLLSGIFKKDSSIAFDWLMVRIEKGIGYLYYDLENERLDTAIKVLDDNQKKSLLKILPDQGKYRKVARILVNSNLELYKFLLSGKQREYLHLAPLKGHPDSDWTKKAKLALDAGHSAKDIAVAARGYSWSWGDRESNMWAEWLDSFTTLLSDSDSRICKVGEIGLQDVKQRMEAALKREHEEDIYGITY